MPCLPPHCAPASHRTNAALLLQLEACSYKKDFFLLTIGSGGHLLGMNFGGQSCWCWQGMTPAAMRLLWAACCADAAAGSVPGSHAVLLLHTHLASPRHMLRVLLPVLAVAGAWKLGLANVMLHATGNESCAVLAEAGYNNVTCVWSDR